MYNIARYQKISDEYTTHRLRHNAGEDDPSPVELCEIDGWTYVALPDGIVLPEQIVDMEYVEPDKAIGTKIISRSRFVRQQMAATGDYEALLYLGMKASAVEHIVWNKMSVDRWTIPADNETPVVITYTATDTVHFVVDGTIYPVEPDDLHQATLEITAPEPGPIRVEVRDKAAVVITAEEVAA